VQLHPERPIIRLVDDLSSEGDTSIANGSEIVERSKKKDTLVNILKGFVSNKAWKAKKGPKQYQTAKNAHSRRYNPKDGESENSEEEKKE